MKRNFKPSISKDSGCRKRIRVRDLDSGRPSTCRRDTSPISLKERHVTYRNNAKTSEFAFFKKCKEDANHRFSSSLPCEKELQSKKCNSSDCFRERASPVEKRCKDFSSSHHFENVSPINFNSMHLSLGNSSKISEADVKHPHRTLEDVQNKQRSVENDDIFFRKRQKLRQFIQNMSFRGTAESYVKGDGVISSLLSRLVSESNQHEFNNNLEKLQWLPGRCFPRRDYEHDLNDSSSPCGLYKSRGSVFSHSDFSTNSVDDNFHIKYGTNEFDCELEGKMTLLDVNTPLSAAVENCRSLIPRLFKPQYGLYDDEPLHLRKQELEPLLLGWNADNINDESSSQLTELNMFAEPPISFADDHPPNLRKSFVAVALCSSPFPSSNHRNVYSLPYSSLTSYQIHGLSRHNVVKDENMDATVNNVHLNFSSVPKFLSQCENYVNNCSSRDFFCAQSANWLMNNVFDDEHQHPSVESLCASGFVFDFGWKYLSSSKEKFRTAYQYPGDDMNSDDVLAEYRSPFIFQPESFFQEGTVCSVDKLSWDAARSDINFDIAEMDYI